MLKLWQINSDHQLLIAQIWPLEKLSHFIFVVKKADYSAKNHILTLIIQPGKDSAAVIPNLSGALNALCTFFFYNKEAYKKYNL